MNDLERRVREVLNDDASLAPYTGPMPEGVRPKVRRRQAASTALVALVAIAVTAGSIVVIRNLAAVPHEIPVEPPVESPVESPVVPVNTQPVFDRTTTMGGLRITSPSDWVLVDYWGLWDADAVSLDSTAVPLLELTNFDAGISTPVCDLASGEPSRLPADGVAIFVMVGNDGIDVGERCGGNVEDSIVGMVSAWGNQVPYHVVLATGPDVSEADRTAANTILASAVWLSDARPFTRVQTAQYVLDGWQDGSTWGLLEARPLGENVELSELEFDPNSAGGSTFTDFRVPDPNAVQGEYVGVVTEAADRVEFHFARGWTPIEARLIDLPPSVPFAYDAYWFGSEPKDSTSGEVVAYDADGQMLGSNLPPLVASAEVGTVRAFGTSWHVKYSTSADGTFSVACVEPASGSTQGPCKRPLGNGVNEQTFNEPVPAVFLSLPIGCDFEMEIRMNDGTVIPALLLGIPGACVAVWALEGEGSGNVIYHFDYGTELHEGARVRWSDLGQVVGDGSFNP